MDMMQPEVIDMAGAPVPASSTSYLTRLLDAGLLIASSADGLYGFSEAFERVAEAVDRWITAWGRTLHAEVLRFPPALSQDDFEHSEYVSSCPELAGVVHCFCGDEKAHQQVLQCIADGEDWSRYRKPAGVSLTPAACYPVYPVMARRGPLPVDGRTIDVGSYCFRHEPSLDPTRLQCFRMREYVRIGTPEQAIEFRHDWLARSESMMRALALPYEFDVANDPFFGRGGKIMAQSQRAQQLKFEVRIPMGEPMQPVACLSFNLHKDFFGKRWHLQTADGEIAHSSCVGFGIERLVLALFWHHGMDARHWPAPLRQTLGDV